MSGTPPKFARALLERVLAPGDREYALADLDEEFEFLTRRSGARTARRWYRRQALASLAPALRTRLKRAVRSMRRRVGSHPGSGRMGEAARDVALAGRTLARSPLTVLVTVGSMGLGIGAVTTVFAAAEGFLWPAAPGLVDPEGLVTIYTSEGDGQAWGSSSFADFQDVRLLDGLADAAVASIGFVSLERGGDADRLIAEVVSANHFSVTGIPAVLGRTLQEGDSDGPAVVLLGHGLWRDRFGSDPGIVGRTLRIDGRPRTVVGVAPEGLGSRRVALVRPDVWIPLEADFGSNGLASDRVARDFVILGRTAPGADRERVQRQLDALAARLAAEFPPAWRDDAGRPRRLSAVPERESRVAPGARAVLAVVAAFFFVATGLVLLIACANVTSLFLVRALGRSREIAVRRALGAGRARIIRLLAAEGVLLGVASAAVGVGSARAMSAGLGRLAPPMDVPLRLVVDPGGRALAFAALVALAASLVFSLVPALRASRPDVVRGLARFGAGRRGWRPGPGALLVVTQFAASFVLLAGAGLSLRSLQGAAALDLGLDPEGIAVATRQAPDEVEEAALLAWYDDLRERADGVEGVGRVALSRSLEMTVLQVGAAATVRSGAPDEGPAGVPVLRNSVTPGYLEMLNVPLLAGRSIQDADGPDAESVAVVNRSFAERFWPGGDALDRTFELEGRGADGGATRSVRVRVVGITADGMYMDLDDPPMPYLWTSLYQDPARTVVVVVEGMDPERLASGLRAGVPPSPGEVPVLRAAPYAAQLELQSIHLRIMARVLGWGGMLGAFLAVIGVYGLVSFSVMQRMREMAIRRAVGAGDGQLAGGVLRQGMGLAAVGLAGGAALLVPLGSVARGVLVGVEPLDPLALGAAAALLLAVAALATWWPARRALRADPMRLLARD